MTTNRALTAAACALFVGMALHLGLMAQSTSTTTPVVVPPASFLSRAAAAKHNIKQAFVIVPCEAGFEYGPRFFVAITIEANQGIDSAIPSSYVHGVQACSAGRVFTIMIPPEMASTLERPEIKWTLTASPESRERIVTVNRAP